MISNTDYLVESYYLDSWIKDDFQCDQDCYIQHREPTNVDHPNICTHDYQHITQHIQDLTDNTGIYTYNNFTFYGRMTTSTGRP